MRAATGRMRVEPRLACWLNTCVRVSPASRLCRKERHSMTMSAVGRREDKNMTDGLSGRFAFPYCNERTRRGYYNKRMAESETAYDPRYLAGVLFFNRRDFFEAHEVWEDLWQECTGPERKFVQALIQAAVALYHFGNGN